MDGFMGKVWHLKVLYHSYPCSCHMQNFLHSVGLYSYQVATDDYHWMGRPTLPAQELHNATCKCIDGDEDCFLYFHREEEEGTVYLGNWVWSWAAKTKDNQAKDILGNEERWREAKFYRISNTMTHVGIL